MVANPENPTPATKRDSTHMSKSFAAVAAGPEQGRTVHDRPPTKTTIATRLSELQGYIRAIEEQNTSLSTELSASQQANARLRSQREQWKKSCISAEPKTGLQERCEELEHRLHQDQKELSATSAKLAETTRALEATGSKQRETEALLEMRTAELRAVQVSLGEPHAVSHCDIHRLVDTLNAEVYQMSALVSDQFPFSREQSLLHLEAWESAYHKIACIVGQGLAHLVVASSHGDDPVLVQIMIQAYFVERVRWIVETWSHLTSPEYDELLARLHKKIFEEETQATSGRWRTLTRRYLDQLAGQDVSIPISLYEHLEVGLIDILTLGSVPLPLDVIRKQVRESFGDKISTIIARALELRRVLGEDMTSSEFAVLCPRYPEQLLDEFMEDTEGPGHSPRKSRLTQQSRLVLCTTELGLYRYERKSKNGEKGTLERNVLAKAKVLLCSMAEEFSRQRPSGNDGR